jgi:hypothetical protein
MITHVACDSHRVPQREPVVMPRWVQQVRTFFRLVVLFVVDLMFIVVARDSR